MAQGHVDIDAEISVRRESDDAFTIETNKGSKIRVRAEDSKECDMWIESIRSCVYEMQRRYIQEKAKTSVYNPDVVSMVAMEGLKQLVQSRGGTQNVSESMLRRKLVKSFGQKSYKEFFDSSLNFDSMIAEIDKVQLRISTLFDTFSLSLSLSLCLSLSLSYRTKHTRTKQVRGKKMRRKRQSNRNKNCRS